jgi:hypothetical protein
MIERLQNKTSDITDCLSQNKQNWNESFYQFLARNFGFKTNAVPFELLAKALPFSVLAKHKDNLALIEALLFGQAGMLQQNIPGDSYYEQLRSEYNFLKGKYNLQPIEVHLWKFMRLRPVNFPTVRIAQFAALIHRFSGLFSKLIEMRNLEEAMNLFDVKASAYWNNHYKFNVLAETRIKKLGKAAICNLIINSVIPFMFVYGEINGKNYLKDRALEWLDKLPAEENSVISKWSALGVQPRSAFETQALLQLRNSYCVPKKCLHCHVGNKLIKQVP